MKKTMLYVGIGSFVFGILLALTGYYVDGSISGLFFGLGGGLSGVGMNYLHRWHVLHSDDQSDYAHHVRQTEIEQRDERNVMLRDRSAYITLNILSVLLGLGYVVFEALYLLKRWIPCSRYAAFGCLALFLLLWPCHWTVLYFIEKKM